MRCASVRAHVQRRERRERAHLQSLWSCQQNMACLRFSEAINGALTMFTSFVFGLVDMVIASLHITRALISYTTSTFVNCWGLHPPCFHADIARPHVLASAHFRDAHHVIKRRAALNCRRWAGPPPPPCKERITKSGQPSLKRSRHLRSDVSHCNSEPAKFWGLKQSCLKVFPEDLIQSQQHGSPAVHGPHMTATTDDAITGTLVINHDEIHCKEARNEHTRSSGSELSSYQTLSDIDEADAGQEHGRTAIQGHDIMVSSDNAKFGMAILNCDTITAAEAGANERSADKSLIEIQETDARCSDDAFHLCNLGLLDACFSGIKPSVDQSLNEVKQTDLRFIHGALQLSEVGLDPIESQLGCNLDESAATTSRFKGFQDISGHKGSDPEILPQTLSIVGEELHVHTGMPFKSNHVYVELKAELWALQQTLCVVHTELERQRNESLLTAQESMAQISLLQKEKAALLLDFMQQQRMAEEKELFDEEALIDVSDSIVKREAELVTLEKEMELYRRKILNAQFGNLERKHNETCITFRKPDITEHFLQENLNAYRDSIAEKTRQISRELSKYSVCPFSPSMMEQATLLSETDIRGVVDHSNKPWTMLPFSHRSLDFRSLSMSVRDTSRSVLKNEILKLLCRLRGVEDDRDLLRRTLEQRRKERWQMCLLQDVAGSLNLLQASSPSKRAIGSTIRLHRACSASDVEADIFRLKRPHSST